MRTGPRVLFVNQTAQVSGAERSLLELLKGLPPRVKTSVACPRGELFDAVGELGIRAHPIAGTDVSFRLHPVHTTKGAAWGLRTANRLRRLAHQVGADVVHANTTRAGLPAALAARTGGAPAVVHIRDWVPTGWLSTAVLQILDAGATAVVTNSRFIASELPPPPLSPVHVIHNPVDTARFDPRRIDRDGARANLGLDRDDVVLAVIAQLTPWKGQDDAIKILALLKPAHPRLRLVLAGSAKFTAKSARLDNAAYERRLHQMARELGVEDEVLFVGERSDVPDVLGASDVLLVPSWKEAFGRIALEGMAMQIPVIASNAGGPAEIVRNGRDGLLLPPRSPEAWAPAVEQLLQLPQRMRAMGRLGRARAIEEFTVKHHVDQVLAVYDSVANGRRPLLVPKEDGQTPAPR
jgi:glycosyltransferase involved in cell wall biosynthesis